jgi:hypothetical protein
MVRETPVAAAQAMGASETPRAFFCNFTSTSFLRTCICKKYIGSGTKNPLLATLWKEKSRDIILLT